MTIADLKRLQDKPLTKAEHGIVSGALKRLHRGWQLTDKQIASLDSILQKGPRAAPFLPLGDRQQTRCHDCGAWVEWPNEYLRHMQASHKDLPGVKWALNKIRSDREAAS